MQSHQVRQEGACLFPQRVLSYINIGSVIKLYDNQICDPLSKNPALPQIIAFRVRGDFIRTGHFLSKLRLLHQGGYRGLVLYHTDSLNYEAWLGYHKDSIHKKDNRMQTVSL